MINVETYTHVLLTEMGKLVQLESVFNSVRFSTDIANVPPFARVIVR